MSVTTEHLVAETTLDQLADHGPLRAALAENAVPEAMPAWSRDEPEAVTDPDGPDERRADAVAEALLSSTPPEPPPDPVSSPPGGSPLTPQFRRWAEERTGANLDKVRMHRSEDGNTRAASLKARAFTVGSDIVLGPTVAPIHTQHGLRTLVHEIGHVVAPPGGGRIGRDDDEEAKKKDKSLRWVLFMPPGDVRQVLQEIPAYLENLGKVKWDQAVLDRFGADEVASGVPDDVLQPATVSIVTENFFIVLAGDGSLVTVDPQSTAKVPPGNTLGVALSYPFKGWVWALGELQRPDKTTALELKPTNAKPALATATLGQSHLVIYLPGVTTPQEVVDDLKKPKATKKNTADTPGWTKDQLAKLRSTKAKKAASPPKEPARNEDEKESKEGSNEGSDAGKGKGDSGEGKGAGTGSGDGVGAGAEPGEAGAGGGKDDPASGGPLKGPVDYSTWQGEKGPPQLVIKQDRAWISIPLKEGESPDGLEKRADEALEKLRESRDPANSLKVADGAKETGFVQPTGSTQGVSQGQAAAEAQARSTPSAVTPGERVPGAKGGANAAAYPAKMTMGGHDPEVPAITVSGATDEFTMDVDYAALSRGFQDEVFNRMQNIQFYWEVIDVSGLTREKAKELAANTLVGEGKQETGAGAMGTNFRRDMNAIAEDQDADLQMMADEDWPWEARAQYLMVIGISNVVRTLGSIIGSFIDVLTEPLNARSIGFDNNGDYIIRCVATPQATEEQRADPEHHVIRASSVAVMPIRVQPINERAREAVDKEQATIDARQAALDAAKLDGSDAKVAHAQAELDAVQTAGRMSGFETLEGQVSQLKASIQVAKELRAHRASGVKDEFWSDDEVRLAITLVKTRTTLDAYLRQRENGLEALNGKDDDHLTWSREQRKGFVAVGGVTEFRPRMVLASEETGQVTELNCMLGQISPGPDAPWKWRLVDVTTAGTRDYYTGSSPLPGAAGREAAIRDAFRNFAENADYGRGTLAIRMPKELTAALGGVAVHVDASMRSRPGPNKRFKGRLADIAKVAAIAGLFATGGLGIAIGAVGGVAGAIGSVDSLVKRARTGHLMDIGTVFDVLGVVGGIAATAQVGTFYARASADGLAKLGKTPTWIQGLERTEKVLHIHAQVGIVQQVVTIPIELAIAWHEIDKSTDSEGKKDSRRLRALLHAAESGLMTIAQLHGPIGKADEPALKAKASEPLPEGAGAPEAHSRADGTGPTKPPVKEAPPVAEGGPPMKDAASPKAATAPSEPPPPPKKTVADQVEEARALAQKKVDTTRRANADETVDPNEGEARTARGTGKGGSAHEARGNLENVNERARETAVEELGSRMAGDRQIPTPAPGTTPPKRGAYGKATTSAKDAVVLYDKAVSEAGGREVGLYFNPNTGEFQVQVGTEHEVRGPFGDGWQAVVHLHPNPGNVTTLRLPAPADIQAAMRAAFRTGSHTEFVQSAMPDGSTGMTKVTITTKPTVKITVELPASGGAPARKIEVNSPEAYAKEYGDSTTYLDPASPDYAWIMQDLNDYYAGREREGQTARGAGSKPAKAPEGVGTDQKSQNQKKIEDLRAEVQRQHEKADPTMRKIYDEELANLKKVEEDEAAGTSPTEVASKLHELEGDLAAYHKVFAPVSVAKVRSMGDRLRAEATKMRNGEVKTELLALAAKAEELAAKMDKDPKHDGRFEYGALARQEKRAAAKEYELVIDLGDANLQKEVFDRIDEGAARLKEDPVGAELVKEILKHLRAADALTLKQSPRSSGDQLALTNKMREAVLAGIKAGRYSPEYIAEFEAGVRMGEKQGKTDGWPRDSAGHSWEVDHVAELWLGGGDEIGNYMPLPLSVHKLKSDLFRKFMNDYRSRGVSGEQVDVRETDPKPK